MEDATGGMTATGPGRPMAALAGLGRAMTEENSSVAIGKVSVAEWTTIITGIAGEIVISATIVASPAKSDPGSLNRGPGCEHLGATDGLPAPQPQRNQARAHQR